MTCEPGELPACMNRSDPRAIVRVSLSFWRWFLPTRTSELTSLRAELRRVLRASGLGESDVHDIVLATHEASVNGMVHGNRLDPAKRVTVEVAVVADGVTVCVADEGDGFDWAPVLRRARARGVPAAAVHGRGIMLMAAVMDEITYGDPGRTVRMRKCVTRGRRSR